MKTLDKATRDKVSFILDPSRRDGMSVEKTFYRLHRPVGTGGAFHQRQCSNMRHVVLSRAHPVPTGRKIIKYPFSTNISSLRDDGWLNSKRMKHSQNNHLKSCKFPICETLSHKLTGSLKKRLLVSKIK